jgi:putative tricarboxylic transport membrane protein
MAVDLLVQGLSGFVGLPQFLATSFGVFVGIVIGIMPGLGPLLGLTLLTPMAMGMNALVGMGLLLGIFVGGTCGGAISAVLLRIPGTPIAAATLFDGYPLAQKGQAPLAVGLSISASAIGGIIGGLFLIFASPLLAAVARRFAPPEYFALALTGIVMIAIVSRGSTLKGLMVGLAGLLVATIGMDPYVSRMRFTFGQMELAGGLGIVPMVIGLFAVSEMFRQLEVGGLDISPGIKAFRAPFASVKVAVRRFWNLFRSSTIGTFVGALPGTGSVIASFLSYSVAKASSRNPDEYGTGTPDGVIATEASNNACCGGVLIPSLSLAIPGDPCSAMLLAALMLLGFLPGPQLFATHPGMVGGIFLAYILSNVMLLLLGLLFTPFFVSILNIKKQWLVPFVLLLCVVGSYGMETDTHDLWIMLLFGGIGYVLHKYEFPVAPLVIARVLGPIMEDNFRRSLIMAADEYSVFVTRPISAVILAINAVALFLTLLPDSVKAKLGLRKLQPQRDIDCT